MYILTVVDENSSSPKVLLSSTDVANWQREWLTIDDRVQAAEQQIVALRAQKAEVTKKLEGAALFVPKVADWLKQQAEYLRLKEEAKAPDDVALTDAIVRILRTRVSPARPVMSRDRIRTYLPAAGYPTAKIQANPNYLYIALKRLVDRNVIIESPPGHYKIR
jgi:hypothetical protein